MSYTELAELAKRQPQQSSTAQHLLITQRVDVARSAFSKSSAAQCLHITLPTCTAVCSPTDSSRLSLTVHFHEAAYASAPDASSSRLSLTASFSQDYRLLCSNCFFIPRLPITSYPTQQCQASSLAMDCMAQHCTFYCQSTQAIFNTLIINQVA